VAAALGKELIEMETNLRSWSEPQLHWSFYHGAALAAAAHLLHGEFDRILIPSGTSFKDLKPWGSHPCLDKHYGFGKLRFVHHGAETKRVQKVEFLAKHPLALEHLRVCYLNRESRYNCGECEKCLRTMLALEAVGALERVKTFPQEINRMRVRRMIVESRGARIFLEEIADYLEKRNRNPSLSAIIRNVLAEKYSSGWIGLARKIYWRFRYS
jgi:hypothetical protein